MEEGRTPAKRPERVARVLVAVTASLALIGGLAVGATAVQWYQLRNVGVDRDWFPEGAGGTFYPKGSCSEQPCNFLLLGSDSRSGLSPDEQSQFGDNQDIGGEARADTIMLVHTDPDTRKSVVLSFPRDLWVDIPGHGMNKINAGFEGGVEHGGPDLMRDTIQNLTGITIDHYLYVDLNGFQQAVGALGGVDMCIPSYYVNTPGDVEGIDPDGNIVSIHYSEVGHIVDPYTGLDVLPGCQHLDGAQALAYVRSRHLPCSDIPDFARIGRQQQFMRAVINQMLQPSQITKAPGLVAPVLSNLQRDQGFLPGDLVYLVGQMRGVSTGEVQFRSVSGTSVFEGQLSVVKMDQASKKLFAAIRDNAPLPPIGSKLPVVAPSEANTTVLVVDAGNPTGALEVEEILTQAGFDITPGIERGDVPKGVRAPAIVYRAGQKDYARVVQAYFPGLPMVEVTGSQDAPVAIVVPDGYHPPSSQPSGGASPAPPAASECPTPSA